MTPTTTAPDSSTPDAFPLSQAQQQLWFLEQLSPGTSRYNVPQLFRIRGALDVDALRYALRMTVDRHEILRARYGERDGVPFQTIARTPSEVLEISDPGGLAADEREAVALADAHTQIEAPFDLVAGPLYRFRLYRLDDRDHLLSLVLHHSVCDGWSVNLLQEEISAQYAARVAASGTSAASSDPATPAPGRYRDVVTAQRDAAADGTLNRHLDYWQEHLTGLPTLELPADRPRPAVADPAGQRIRVHYDRQTHETLLAAARRDGCSLSMLATAALAVVLGAYTRETDVALGTTALGRTEPEWESVVGLFVNAVVLRLDLSGDPAFAEFASRVRDTTLDAFDHQAATFDQVVDRLGVARDSSRNPLFQVMIQTLNESTGSGSLRLADAAVEPVETEVSSSRFDLVFSIEETADGLVVNAEYATALFDGWRIERLLAHYERVLRTVASDPGIRLSAIGLLDEGERARVLAMGDGADEPLRRVPAHTLIEERAAVEPDAVAVWFEGAQTTYGELWRQAEALAGYLRHTLNVGHEEIVAVAADRGLYPVLAFLGVSKSGGAYVPLDIEHPVNRLEYILDDAAVRVVITTSDLLDRLPERGERTYVLLDADWTRIEQERATRGEGGPLADVSTGDSLVNVLYTSGTTGRPKGVLTEHRGLASYVTPFVRTYGLGPGDRVLQFANLAFDLCQAEIYAALTSGATLICARKDTLHTPERLMALLREQEVSYLGAPPTMLGMLEPEPYPALRHVFVGGEACPAEIANRWNLPGRLFVNGYGPTEAAIGATMHPVPRLHYRVSPPIGGPLPHRRLYVVDPDSGALLPVGVPGELLIGGDEGVARGYLNQPELTGQKFVPDPFHPDARVYRTGDLARWNNEGHLEFLGRIDSQVKLRGLRIELEEIETVLLNHPSVRQAAVTLTEDLRGLPMLAAYVTPTGTDRPNLTTLRHFVGEYVPVYMVPTAWTVLENLPLSSTGKLSRKALPRPDAAALVVDAERTVEAPETLAERQIAAAFAEVLGLPVAQIGAQDDFFEIGGNSLQAMRVISRINRQFPAGLGVRALYGAPNLREFALRVEAASAGAANTTSAGAKPPATPATDRTQNPEPELFPASAEAVAALFAEVLPTGSRPIGPQDNLFALGAREDQGTELLDLLERRSGIRLTSRDLFTPAVLAAALDARRAAERWSPLVPLSAGSGRFAPLFCLPGASGSPSVFAGTARKLLADRPVIGLEAPGLEPGLDPLRSVEELAAQALAAIRARQPEGPYHLLGWSMGGLVAYEAARLLHERGETVEFLALVDTAVPDPAMPEPDDRHLFGQFAAELAGQAGLPAPVLAPADDRAPDAGLPALFAQLHRSVLPDEPDEEQLRRRFEVYLASARAAFAFRPRWTYPGRLDVLRASVGSAGESGQWSAFAERAREYRVPGNHFSLWSAEHRPVLATVIDTLLGTVAPCEPGAGDAR